MIKWELSKAASRDLEQIIRYTIENWGLRQGKKYDKAIIDALDELCINPEKGRSLSSLVENTRKWQVEHHLVIYSRTSPNTLAILRILHKKMDIKRHV